MSYEEEALSWHGMRERMQRESVESISELDLILIEREHAYLDHVKDDNFIADISIVVMHEMHDQFEVIGLTQVREVVRLIVAECSSCT